MKTQGNGIRTPLIAIHRPNDPAMKSVAFTSGFYSANPIAVYELSTGGFVSCETVNGWIDKWYEGDYRKETENWPMSQSQYYEF